MTRSNFNFGPGLFIIGYHLLLLAVLPFYFMHYVPSWTLASISFGLLYITGLAVTAGYHRLFSHRTYKAHPAFEAVLIFFATMATQGSALRWAYEHRNHHAFVDTDRDPYSIKKGFWYAHFLWLFEKPKPIDEKVVADLMRKPLLRFQDRYYPYLMIATNVLAVGLLGWALNDYVGAFVIGWLLRMFLLHHFTWFINSLAHTWGARPFCQEQSAVDNYVICLLTFGEGYHNYHHTFAHDYRNGIRWYHFDPTKWLIWTMSKLGLVQNLKRVQHYSVQEKLLIDRKRLLLEKLHSSYTGCKAHMEENIETLAARLLNHLRQGQQLTMHYQGLKAKGQKTEYLRELELQLKEWKKGFSRECRQWMQLSRQILTC